MLRRVTSQKTAFFIVTAVKTSNPTSVSILVVIVFLWKDNRDLSLRVVKQFEETSNVMREDIKVAQVFLRKKVQVEQEE
jgi:hypothetical protein